MYNTKKSEVKVFSFVDSLMEKKRKQKQSLV